jgi:nitroimidazol reductase NimA-like FMN-containing flavoprotein (pyridoxamine 5'-phosphate oxidase superfamily)
LATSAELVELDHGECLRLLAGRVVGRVVFTDDALPAAQPVNYLLDGEEVVFRTGAGSKLASATRNSVVAFQVDEIDACTHIGWSVLGIGEAYEVFDPGRLADLARRQPAPGDACPWAHAIAIPLQRLTGRKLTMSSATE